MVVGKGCFMYYSIYFICKYILIGIIMGFGARLKTIRRSLGLSQDVVGQQLGMPQSAVAKIESDKVDMRVSTLQNLARMMGCEVVLVPKPLLGAVHTLISGEALSRPRWQTSDDGSDA